MKSSIQRILGNRWAALALALVIGCISVWVLADVAGSSYYNYYEYPKLKGNEYRYPELRYALGQAAILVWSLLGVCSSGALFIAFTTRKPNDWAANTVMAFGVGFVLVVLGFIIGMSMRGVL